MNYTRTRFLIGALLSFGAWLVMLIWGGKDAAADAWARGWLTVAGRPALESFAHSVAWLGEWQVLTGAAVLGTIVTAISPGARATADHDRHRPAAVEIQKLLVGRVTQPRRSISRAIFRPASQAFMPPTR